MPCLCRGRHCPEAARGNPEIFARQTAARFETKEPRTRPPLDDWWCVDGRRAAVRCHDLSRAPDRTRARHRDRRKSIGLEQSDTEDEREGDPALRGPHDARLRLEHPDRLFKRSQPLGAHEIAFVEQNDIAVTKLAAGGLAVEPVEAKASGIE